ncbi:MAG: FAD:protein FMN transferase [Candidatus Omnitrophica bacterium]|nr:FAD:protein FMN transferase [Candidatus Omnitrophota bacterium]MDD5027201.1 FAD:protein FMN transferase [Candidatus Omnitrophota bacterium]MDD5662346.1 FAD:protein FMN transferase [Candidatus Omnitrophota bacterium]
MPSDKISRYLLTLLVLGCGIAFVYLALEKKAADCPARIIAEKPLRPVDQALDLLRIRKNKDALVILDRVLLSEPKDPEAIWGKAEIFRRARQDKLAKLMFQEVLEIKADHQRALLSLAYIEYNDGNLNTALKLTRQAFIVSGTNRQNRALAYILLGLINSARPFNGGMIARINRGLEIKDYFLKAVRLAPELPETHLYLGTFYLEAPLLEGRDLKKAIRELKYALEIAPDFTEASALLARAYSQDKSLYRARYLMMGTYLEVISPDPKAGKIVFDEFRRIENLLSKYDSGSEIAQLNRAGYLKVSPETFYVIKKSQEFWSASQGAFDITTGVLVDLWGFGDRQYRVPKKEELEKALELTGSDKIILQERESVVQFKLSGMKLDLGGIAKGYALDCAVRKLKESGIKSCLINTGGQVYCLGERFAKPWRIALKAAQSNAITGYLELKNRCVATSGGYEQYFSQDKKRYPHILNPQTGYPADSRIISVTVIARDGLTADALATAIFVLGKDKGEALARQFDNVRVNIIEDTRVQNN